MHIGTQKQRRAGKGLTSAQIQNSHKIYRCRNDYGKRPWSNEEAVGTEQLTLWEQEVGTPVFIDERCIAAAMAAGTVYE